MFISVCIGTSVSDQSVVSVLVGIPRLIEKPFDINDEEKGKN